MNIFVPQIIKEMCQNYKSWHVSNMRTALREMRNVVCDMSNALCNMEALQDTGKLCNMGVLCDMRNVLYDKQSVLCNKGSM